jgi:hypothetical protein
MCSSASKLAGLLRLVEQFERRLEAQPLEAAHQRLVAEDGARRDLGDRLEGVFDGELCQRDDLVVTEAAQGQHFGGGVRRTCGISGNGREIARKIASGRPEFSVSPT